MATDPKGRSEPGYYRHVFICGHERPPDSTRGCCREKNSLEIMRSMKYAAKALGLADVRVQKSGCLDFCENGISCVIYPEGVWYSLSCEEDAMKVVSSHLANGQVVEELLMNLVD
ncbi:MAG: hypothetical protein NZ802_10915 [Candidatus Poseidoniales archaeon]|nr:hypothetical protein [Candidatus Poseidoniales archaeon]